MTLQLYINGKLACEQFYSDTSRRKAAIESLKRRFGYSIKHNAWQIFEVGVPSKMNHPDFSVDENQIYEIAYHKEALLKAS
jgi:hypothetical protein